MEKDFFTHSFEFKSNGIDPKKTIIKVIGVGGGGTNAANHMYRQGIENVNFAVLNTDAQALNDSPIPVRVQLGAKLTDGLGAGTDPEQGEAAAIESKEDIFALLNDGTRMVFITAGMGGGTGTGAAPVVAQIARELGLLTVAIVTAPSSWEGDEKINSAVLGMNKLKDACDTLLVVLNDKLIELYPDDDIETSFARADDVLLTAAKSVAEVITKSGKVNIDFMDVKNVLTKAGQAVMGSATESGDERAKNAINAALESPLLNNRNIKGAKRVLISASYSESNKIKNWEQAIITETIRTKINAPTKGVKFGIINDNTLGDALRLTVIVAGFDLHADASFPSEPILPLLKAQIKEEIAIEDDIPEIEVVVEEPAIIDAQPVVKQPVTKQESSKIAKDTADEKIRIQKMVSLFAQNTIDEVTLEIPTYERYNIALIDTEKIEGTPVRYNLNEK